MKHKAYMRLTLRHEALTRKTDTNAHTHIYRLYSYLTHSNTSPHMYTHVYTLTPHTHLHTYTHILHTHTHFATPPWL